MTESAPHIRNDLLKFFAITFAFSWLVNLPRLFVTAGLLDMPAFLYALLGYLAVFGPGVAAFWLTFAQGGRPAARELWRRGWRMNFDKKWLVPALVLMPILGLVTYALMLLLKEPIFWEYSVPPAMIVPVALLIWLLGAYPEEYGWRGYALDRLQARYSPLVASIILGAVWALWHLPLHFIDGTTQFVIPVWQFALQIFFLNFLFTWLYNRTRGSVFIAALFHATGNITAAVLPFYVTNTGRLLGLLPIIVVVIMVITCKGLSRKE